MTSQCDVHNILYINPGKIHKCSISNNLHVTGKQDFKFFFSFPNFYSNDQEQHRNSCKSSFFAVHWLLFISTFTPLLLPVGAVFALMEHLSVCEELVRELLLDLPLLSSPVILLCMNKELRNQCLLLLQRRPTNSHVEREVMGDECSHFTSVP